MNPSPSSTPSSLEAQRRLLAAWLHERHLDITLRDPAPPIPPATGLRYDRPPPATWSSPRPGSIHLLRPTPGPSSWGPVYVCLLEATPSGIRAAPFSRYAVPAVPGEVATELPHAPLRVLCLWNHHLIPAHRLMPQSVASWPARAWPAILAYHQHLAGKSPSPTPRKLHIGPPLIHPADPRHDYLEEERQRLHDHIHSPAALNHESPATIIAFDSIRPAWRLAAEGRPPYNPS
ncbi:MAG TPA: hypothetical protein PKE55_05480 [Kiritimatiellia bacterium]|nr:hypothetical protein [Kiritimatiellia bacterium]